MRRRLLAAVMAAVLAFGGAVVARHTAMARQMSLVQPSPCVGLNPDTNWFLWWWNGCESYATGGGGGGVW